MIVELRTYKFHPGALATFLDLYEAGPMAIQRATLGNLIGYFVTESGALNTVVHLWAYINLDDRIERRNSLAANPKWQEFLATVLPLMQSQESLLLRPTGFSPIHSLGTKR